MRSLESSKKRSPSPFFPTPRVGKRDRINKHPPNCQGDFHPSSTQLSTWIALRPVNLHSLGNFHRANFSLGIGKSSLGPPRMSFPTRKTRRGLERITTPTSKICLTCAEGQSIFRANRESVSLPATGGEFVCRRGKSLMHIQPRRGRTPASLSARSGASDYSLVTSRRGK